MGPITESDLITRDVSDGLRYANADRLQLRVRPRHEETVPPAKMATPTTSGNARNPDPSHLKRRSSEENRMSKLGSNHREDEKQGGWVFGETEGQCGSP